MKLQGVGVGVSGNWEGFGEDSGGFADAGLGLGLGIPEAEFPGKAGRSLPVAPGTARRGRGRSAAA